jgi:hypothetical protein
MARATKTSRRGRPKAAASKSSVLSLRLDPNLRSALEGKASEGGHSLSHEIHARLKASLYDKKDEDPILRAFCFLFGRAASMDVKNGHWAADRYKFEVFRTAVIAILDHFAPQGEIEPPDIAAIVPEIASEPELAAVFKSTQAAGALHATTVLTLLRAPENEAANLPASLETWNYPRARKALGLAVDSSAWVNGGREINRIASRVKS